MIGHYTISRWLAAVLVGHALVASSSEMPPLRTVFVIAMENQDWAAIKGNCGAAWLNSVLLPRASRCEQYYNPPGLHPSLPNY